MTYRVEDRIFTEDEANRIWDILIEECGATEHWRENFVHWVAHQNHSGREFRFQGHLGFGGKIWFYLDKIYVNCYLEDETDERRAMIARANTRLKYFVSDLPDAIHF